MKEKECAHLPSVVHNHMKTPPKSFSKKKKSLFSTICSTDKLSFKNLSFLHFKSKCSILFQQKQKTTFSNVILFLLLNPRQKLRSGNSKKHFLIVYFVGGGGGPCQRINMRSYFICSMTDTRTTRLKPNH